MREKNQIIEMVQTSDKLSYPGKNSTEDDIEEACRLLNAIVDILSLEKRQTILKSLPPKHPRTFEELRQETGLSTGSLHNHLTELWRAGFVDKTGSRPAKYSRSKALEYMLMLAEEATKNSKTTYDMHSQKYTVMV